MTHWINPDVSLAVWNGTGAIPVSPVLIAKGATLPTNTVLSNTAGAFDQYGMEFNPIAINEVLAYSFLRKDAGGTRDGDPPLLHRAGQHADVAGDRHRDQQRQHPRPERTPLQRLACDRTANPVGQRLLGHHLHRRPGQQSPRPVPRAVAATHAVDPGLDQLRRLWPRAPLAERHGPASSPAAAAATRRERAPAAAGAGHHGRRACRLASTTSR